jgi:hypothetical protein
VVTGSADEDHLAAVDLGGAQRPGDRIAVDCAIPDLPFMPCAYW